MKLLRILGLIGCLLLIAGCGANTVTRGSTVNTSGGDDTAGDGFLALKIVLLILKVSMRIFRRITLTMKLVTGYSLP